MSWRGQPVCDIHGHHCDCYEDRGQFGNDDDGYSDDYGVYADQAEDRMIAGWDEALSR